MTMTAREALRQAAQICEAQWGIGTYPGQIAFSCATAIYAFRDSLPPEPNNAEAQQESLIPDPERQTAVRSPQAATTPAAASAPSSSSRIEALLERVSQFDSAIQRIGAHVGACCGGVDTGHEIDQNTGEPYGPGGHTAVEIIRKIDERTAQSATGTPKEFAERCWPAARSWLNKAERLLLDFDQGRTTYPAHYRSILDADADRARKLLDEIEAIVGSRPTPEYSEHPPVPPYHFPVA